MSWVIPKPSSYPFYAFLCPGYMGKYFFYIRVLLSRVLANPFRFEWATGAGDLPCSAAIAWKSKWSMSTATATGAPCSCPKEKLCCSAEAAAVVFAVTVFAAALFATAVSAAAVLAAAVLAAAVFAAALFAAAVSAAAVFASALFAARCSRRGVRGSGVRGSGVRGGGLFWDLWKGVGEAFLFVSPVQGHGQSFL